METAKTQIAKIDDQLRMITQQRDKAESTAERDAKIKELLQDRRFLEAIFRDGWPKLDGIGGVSD